MTEYTVTWTIDVEADCPIDAAMQCLGMVQDPDSTTKWVWNVAERGEIDEDKSTWIDLDEVGTCDFCHTHYYTAEDDHCGQCGTCWDHCDPDTHEEK